MKVEVSKYACMFRTTSVQKRVSRRKRLNKKFRKKYGWKPGKCKGAAWNVGGVLLCCPCVYKQLQVQYGFTSNI